MRILIAGGGTGGHVYPAISIAEAILNLDPTSTVEFVGTPHGLESRLVPRSGFILHRVSIGRLNNNVPLFERIQTLCILPFAILKSFYILLRFRPDAVLGVGGYASGPLVFAAALLRFKTFIWEPNAYPGLANRILAKYVDQTLIVFFEAARFLKNKNIRRVHMPIRSEIENSPAKKKGNSKFRILIFGGSQGARAINNIVSQAIAVGGAWLTDTEIVHQTGIHDFARIKRIYDSLHENREAVKVLEYLNDMPERYAWADLIISRSGTGTISELAACGKASILVPLPTAADDHQTKNARALVDIGGARLIPQSEFSIDRLIEEVMALKFKPEQLAQLEENIKKFHKPGAAAEIAKIILEREKL